MAIREILKMGDPRLLKTAQLVPSAMFGTPELKQLIADMFDTMHANNGVGLAAPQIGIDAQLVVFGFEHDGRYPDLPDVPLTVLMNPVITPLGTEQENDWEGCLSVPGMRGVVPRWTHIRYEGVDPDGLKIVR
jgi:peptide deformylase